MKTISIWATTGQAVAGSESMHLTAGSLDETPLRGFAFGLVLAQQSEALFHGAVQPLLVAGDDLEAFGSATKGTGVR